MDKDVRSTGAPQKPDSLEHGGDRAVAVRHNEIFLACIQAEKLVAEIREYWATTPPTLEAALLRLNEGQRYKALRIAHAMTSRARDFLQENPGMEKDIWVIAREKVLGDESRGE